MTYELQRHINQDIINRHNYNSYIYLGKLNELINNCKPNSLEDWIKYYNKYLIETKKNIVIKDIINKIIEKYDYIKKSDVKECFRKRVYDDCYNGYIREQNSKKYLEDLLDAKLVKSNDFYDRNYGVDFLVIKDEEIIKAIQIKPLSYFKSTHPGVIRDRGINKNKYEKFKNETNIDVIEVAFEDNEIVHNLEEIIKINGI